VASFFSFKMDCLQCGLEMKMEISTNVSDYKNGNHNMSANYYCYPCDMVFHVMMSRIYHVKNNLILNKGKWKTEDKWKLESFQ